MSTKETLQYIDPRPTFSTSQYVSCEDLPGRIKIHAGIKVTRLELGTGPQIRSIYTWNRIESPLVRGQSIG